MNHKIALRTAKLLLDIKSISLNINKPFKFTSGIYSPIYIDNRIIISYPIIRKKIIDFYIQVIKNKVKLNNIDILSGTATAAIPQTAFIAQRLRLPMVYVRSTKKGHGKQNQIEGIIQNNQKVLLIEDHISTGGSLINNYKAIKSAGGVVDYAVATTTYLMAVAKTNLKKLNLKVICLTDLNYILKVAVRDKLIKKKDKYIIFDWAKNPKQWSKKHGCQ
jgi:orotate phosphoribosyltransferase